MGMVFPFLGVGWISLCLAMSIDAYQVEFDSDIEMGPWSKYLWPIIMANPGIYFIVEGIRIGLPQ